MDADKKLLTGQDNVPEEISEDICWWGAPVDLRDV